MKKNALKHVLKAVFAIAFAGTIALSGVGGKWTGMETVEAAKLLPQAKTLGKVTGIAYDAVDKRITWNKVAGATSYYVEVKDAQGNSYGYGYPDRTYYNVDYPDGKYTVTVTAKDNESYYVVASNLTNSEAFSGKYTYDTYDSAKDAKGVIKYTLYRSLSGTPGTGVIQIKTPQISKDTITKLPYILQKEVTDSGVVYTIPSSVVLNRNEEIIWQYSNNKYFSSRKKGEFAYTSWSTTKSREIGFNNFSQGETMYVRARVYNNAYNDWSGGYSEYTKTLTYAVPKFEMDAVSTTVTASTIELSASVNNGRATGYQFAKKSGSRWVTLETQNDPTYTDKGLAKDKKYQYRVRAYYYNKNTRKTVWSSWKTVKAVTWGANMNFRAAAASSTSVKLTWKPVSGAEGYEIYRYETGSGTTNVDKGIGIENFGTNVLIKTFKGSRAKSYTNKGLTKGESYTYYIRAYKTVDKQKTYLEGSAWASLKAGDLSGTLSYVNSKGQKVVTWSKQTGLKGYYVEKQDKVTQEFTLVKKLKASATSYTFPSVNVGSNAETYRIRPYTSKAVFDGEEFTVSPALASVTGVKAVKKDNGVLLTWKPVAGADYYRVYRTTNSDYVYNKTAKTYSYFGGETVYEGAVNTTGCNPEYNEGNYKSMGTYATSEIRDTKVFDTALVYEATTEDAEGKPIAIGKTASGKTLYQTEEAFYQGVEGPEAGTTYYYYVRAYADAPNGSLNYITVSSAGASKAVKVTYTNKAVKKVSKISSLSSKKRGQVTVTYKKVRGVSGYAVYRSTKKNGTYTMVGTTTKTTFTDTSAVPGKSFYYKVASYVKGENGTNIYSAKTAAKSVKVK